MARKLTGLHLLPLVGGDPLVLVLDAAVREEHPHGLGAAARVEVDQLVLWCHVAGIKWSPFLFLVMLLPLMQAKRK